MWLQSPSAVEPIAIQPYEPLLRGYRSMSTKDEVQIDAASRSLVLSSLEVDQLVKAKQRPVPRRYLKGSELFILWSLRLYLLFMMLVVAYQVWAAAH
jgi:hypothetical protein